MDRRDFRARARALRALGAAMAAGALALAGTAHATITFYNSEAAFLAAAGSTVGNTTAFNFNSTPYLNYATAAGLTIDGVNFVGNKGDGAYSLYLTPAYFCCGDYNNPNVTVQAPAVTSVYYGETDGSTAITLPGGVTAFGLDAYTVQAGDYGGNGYDTLNLTVSGQTGTTETAPGSTTGFIGFVSTTPVTAATLQGTGAEDFIDITDGVLVSGASGVPEPGAWVLMFGGVAAIGAVLRRNRRTPSLQGA